MDMKFRFSKFATMKNILNLFVTFTTKTVPFVLTAPNQPMHD